MRLTLRTLLAWMDGVVLPADDQQQLGEKVEASPVARDLVKRIRDAIHNPRLSAPRIEGRGLGLDANSVAEFLDNTLPGERLEAFERICLESEIHLAEVAACHGLLSELSKDSSILKPLDAATRRRLLDSMQHRIGVAASAGSTPVPPGHRPFEAPRYAPLETSGGAISPLPAPRSTPWTAWIAALAALALLVLLGAVFANSAGMFRTRPSDLLAGQDVKGGLGPAADNPAVPLLPAPAEPDEATVSTDHGVALEPPAADAAAIAMVALPPVAAPLEALADAGDVASPAPEIVPDADPRQAPAADVAADPAAAVATGPRKVPAGEALAIAAGVRPARPSPAGPVAAGAAGIAAVEEAALIQDAFAAEVGLEAAGEPAVGHSLGLVAGDGIVLRRVSDNGGARGGPGGPDGVWAPIGAGAALGEREELIVPPGFHPQLIVGGLSLRLLPRSMVVLWRDDDGTPRVEVVFGRMVARGGAEDRLGITAGGLLGVVSGGLDGGMAVAVDFERHPGDDPAAVPTRASVTAIGKPLHWEAREAGVAATDLAVKSSLCWDSAGDGPAITPPVRLLWWVTSADRIEPLERGACETLVTRLAALPAARDSAVGLLEVLQSMALDRRAENRMLAATTQTLLGNDAAAVELLSAEAPGKRLEGRQWLALEAATMPLGLSRGPVAAERVRRTWEEKGPAGKAERITAMARGLTDAELAAGADKALVEALSDADLVVRRYAIKCLIDIVQPSAFDRQRYRPDGLEETRREGVGWWRNLLEKGRVRRAPPG